MSQFAGNDDGGGEDDFMNIIKSSSASQVGAVVSLGLNNMADDRLTAEEEQQHLGLALGNSASNLDILASLGLAAPSANHQLLDDENNSTSSVENQQPQHSAAVGGGQQQDQQQALREELMDSGDELPPAEEDDDPGAAPVHEIRCGLLTGRLHMRRFTCPGIHRKCVEYEGKLISPRQFTIKAEKDKQKDWKGSIRLGKHNLRTLMEMKSLDFFEHANNCSLKCQSRNYIKNRKNEGSGPGSAGSQAGEQQPTLVDQTGEHQAASTAAAENYDMVEANDFKSITSASSAASTRKSSAVLEDYVSQTVSALGFAYAANLGGGEIANAEELVAQNRQNQSGQRTPTNGGGGRADREKRERDAADRERALGTPQHHGTNGPGNAFCSLGLSSPAPPANIHFSSPPALPSATSTAFGTLLHQQSPLKQLFAAKQPNAAASMLLTGSTAHGQLPLFGAIGAQQNLNGNGLMASTTAAGHPKGISASRTAAATAMELALPPASLQQHQQDATTLALLLQSLQSSILLDQQNKAMAHSGPSQPALGGGNGTSGGSLLAQLAAMNTIAQQQQRGQSQMAAGPNGNGIERLLSAAAMFPQLQQQKTTPSAAMGLGLGRHAPAAGGEQPPSSLFNVANIRKTMEDNSSLFWSQMRNMGLLEDMFRTLSDMLDRLKQIYVTGGSAFGEEFAAQRLSRVAIALDLCSQFGERIHSRYIQATLESNLIRKELLELQRKQEEQKQKLENAKRKSQVFDQLLKSGAVTESPAGAANGLHGPAAHSSPGADGHGPPEMKKIHLNI